MKKIISKVLIILIVFLLLFDFVFASQYRCVFAAGPGEVIIDGITNLAGGIVAIIYTLLKALIVGLTFGVQVLTTVTASASGINTEGSFWKQALDTITPITPIDIFFNKYKLLDINFFDFEGVEEGSYLYLFRMSIAEWYAIMKLIAAAILLVILIYVGIRMAISTIADDKAKYKKMFADWVVSLLLIFVLQYIIIFTIYCNTAIVNALETAFADSSMSEDASESILKIGIQGIIGSGIISFASVLVYIFIVFQTIIFLLAYMKRMIKVGFLIMISPLISITYSIDKMGDGKAQALGNWLKEFVYTILIQPFHCIIYLALVQTAVELLQGGAVISVFDIAILNSIEYNQLAAGVLAIMCLKFVNDGEQIVRKIFGFKDDNSTGFGAGAALGLAAIANAKKIGGATRKATNKFKSTANKYGKALSTDAGKIRDIGNKVAGSKFGQKIADSSFGKGVANSKIAHGMSSAKKTIGNVTEKVKERSSKKSEKKRNIKGARAKKKQEFRDNHKVLSKMGDTLKSKASVSTALGIMGAAMMYSSGNNGAMESIAAGTAIKKGTQEFFGSSNKTQAEDCKEDREELEKQAHEEQIENKTEMKNGKEVFTEGSKKALEAYKELDRLNAIKAAQDGIKSADKNIKELEENSPDKVKEIEDEKERKKKLEEFLKKNDTEDLDKKIKDQERIINEYDKDGNLAGYRDENGDLIPNEDGTIQRFSEDDVDAWHNSAEAKFDKERKDRFKMYIHKPDTKTLDKAKDEIIAKLVNAKMASKRTKEGLNCELTVDELDTVNATAQALMDNISLGVLNKKGFGTEAQKKLIISKLDLEKDGQNYLFGGVNDFQRATQEYTNLARQSHIASNYEHAQQYNDTKNSSIVEDAILDREVKLYNNTHPRPQRKITTSGTEV